MTFFCEAFLHALTGVLTEGVFGALFSGYLGELSSGKSGNSSEGASKGLPCLLARATAVLTTLTQTLCVRAVYMPTSGSVGLVSVTKGVLRAIDLDASKDDQPCHA